MLLYVIFFFFLNPAKFINIVIGRYGYCTDFGFTLVRYRYLPIPMFMALGEFRKKKT